MPNGHNLPGERNDGARVIADSWRLDPIRELATDCVQLSVTPKADAEAALKRRRIQCP
jgi:hypothetical protein